MVIRKGMWVAFKGRVGILLVSDKAMEIHIVDQDGLTVEVIKQMPAPTPKNPKATRGLTVADFTRAAFNDIPEPRRPSEAVAKALGYL